MSKEKERLLKELKFRNNEIELIIYKLEERILYLIKQKRKKEKLINKMEEALKSFK